MFGILYVKQAPSSVLHPIVLMLAAIFVNLVMELEVKEIKNPDSACCPCVYDLFYVAFQLSQF